MTGIEQHADFGQRKTGYLVDPTSFERITPLQWKTGVVATLYPEAPNVVRVIDRDGIEHIIRWRA